MNNKPIEKLVGILIPTALAILAGACLTRLKDQYSMNGFKDIEYLLVYLMMSLAALAGSVVFHILSITTSNKKKRALDKALSENGKETINIENVFEARSCFHVGKEMNNKPIEKLVGILIPTALAILAGACYLLSKDQYIMNRYNDIENLLVYSMIILSALAGSVVFHILSITTSNKKKRALDKALSENGEETINIENVFEARSCFHVDKDSVLHPGIKEILHFMATLIPNVPYEELNKEQQTLLDVGVYLQHQRIDQALNFLEELNIKSLHTKELMERLMALKNVEGVDPKSFEIRKLKQENERLTKFR